MMDTILVVEDQEGERKTLSTILKDDGYMVICVENGSSAISEAKKRMINLAIVDIKLPDMNGVDVLKKIKDINNETVIIMVTAFESLESIVSALDKGAYTYLLKPLHIDKLKIIIKKSLEKQKLSIENKELLDKLTGANNALNAKYLELKQACSKVEEANLKLKELDNLKSTFLANTSHELKTPLTSIQGYVDLILEKEKDNIPKKIYENLRKVSFHSHQLSSLINNLIHLSQIESGNFKLNLQKVSVKKILDAAINNSKIFANKKDIEINILENKNIDYINGDEEKLIELFSNLLNNAIKFSVETNKIDIWYKLLAEKEAVEIYVKDYGVGIIEEKHEQIFDKFYQVDDSTVRLFKGVGLGLTIVKEIIESHNGDIRIESEINKGATFIISLPIYKENIS